MIDTKFTSSWALGLGARTHLGHRIRQISVDMRVCSMKEYWKRKKFVSNLKENCTCFRRFRWRKSKVKIRKGTWSNRRSKMAKKYLGWRRHGRYYITGARRQKFEAAEWSWIQPGVIGLLRQVTYEVILDDHNHFESLAWPCMIARWHH